MRQKLEEHEMLRALDGGGGLRPRDGQSAADRWSDRMALSSEWRDSMSLIGIGLLLGVEWHIIVVENGMDAFEVVWPTAVEEQVTLKLTLVLSDQRHYNAATVHVVEDLGANPHVRNFYARVLDLATRGNAGEADLSCCEVSTDFSYAGGCVSSFDLVRQVSIDGDCDICSGCLVGSAVEPSWDVRRSTVVVQPLPRADTIIGRHVRLVSDSPVGCFS